MSLSDPRGLGGLRWRIAFLFGAFLWFGFGEWVVGITWFLCAVL